jgi:hypothetical protein
LLPGTISFVPLPVQVSAFVVVGFVQTLKSCGTVPPFVTVNVTEPCATVFVDSFQLNSDGLPAVTVTVAVVRAGLARAVGTATSTSAAKASSGIRACLVIVSSRWGSSRPFGPGSGCGFSD